jgi:hypothetical protein
MGSGVVGKLHEWNKFCPVIDLKIAKNAEVLF